MKDNPAFLLVATPDAPAGVRESVLLVAVHGDGGSLGFVINRPLDMSMREAVLGLGIDPMDAKLGGEVCKGGETEVDSAWPLFEGKSVVPSDSCHLTDDIHVTASPDAAANLLLRRPAPRLMLCRGHTTWDPGELEAELAEGRWLRTEASLRLLFETPATRRWSDAICQCLGLTRRWLGDTRFLRA